MSERKDPAGPDQDRQASSRTHAARPTHDHVVLRHTLRVSLAVALVLWFIVAALLLGLRYVVLPRVDLFRPRIEALLSERLHAQFRIGRLAPHWSGFQPGIDVTDLTIRDRHGRIALDVPHATATVAWRSLLEFAPLLSSLIVDRPDVLIQREDDGTLAVAGVQVPNAHTGNATFSTWLLRQQAIVFRGGTLRWLDSTRDAPELKLHDIRLAILNDGYEHRFALQAPSEGTVLHGPLDFRARFTHARFSQAGKPVDWDGDAYLSTGPVDLPTLARYVHLPITTYTGRIGNAIWAHFAHGRIQSASGVLDGAGVALRVRPTQPKLDVPIAHFDWHVDMVPGEFRLKLSDFHAELGQPPLADGTPLTRVLSLSALDAHFRQQSIQHGQLFSVRGDRIDLGILAEFMRTLPLPQRVLNELVRFNPRGLVANYDLGMERAKPEANESASEQRGSGNEPIVHYRFKGDLQGISVAAQEPPPGLTPRNHPRAGLPGVENLWGHIDADETHGRIRLDTANAAVTLPGVFDDPRLTFDRLYGAADWTVADHREPGDTHKAFSVNVTRLGVANAGTDASMTARYSNPGHGRGTLDLKAVFARAQVAAIGRYLPTSISDRTRHFLAHGLQGGVSRGATIEVHGDLTKFPYTRDPQAGVFRIVAPFTGGRFDPTPYPPRRMRNGVPSVWPAFDGIDGVFEQNNNKLRFNIARGHYRGFELRDVRGRIDDTGTPASDLVIAGNGRGPLADLIDYANRSSLGAMSHHVGDQLNAQGPATLRLTLRIPRHPRPLVRVAGALGFENDRLAFGDAPPLANVSGHVTFTNRSAATDHLGARFLGGDVRASGGLREDGRYAFDLNGDIAADAARRLDLRGPAAALLKRVDGHAPYALSVRGARGSLPRVSASSDLSALALDLPAPFGKHAGEPMSFAASVQPDDEAGPGVQHASLRFGPLAANYLLRPMPDRQLPQVLRGAIGLNRPADLPTDGVEASADLPVFDADAWRQVFQQLRPAARGQRQTKAADGGAVGATRAGAATAATMTATAPTTAAAAAAATATSAAESAVAEAARTATTTITATPPSPAAATMPAPVTATTESAAAATGTTVTQPPPMTTAATEPPATATPQTTMPTPPAAPPARPTARATATTTTTTPPATAAASPPSPLASAIAPYLPSRIAVHVGTLTLLKRHWENLVVGASHSGNEWQANVASNQVSGHLAWRPGDVPGAPGTVEARLARLVVPAATENDLLGQAISTPVQNMPAIDMVVNQLIVHDHVLGRLKVNAHNLEEDGVPVWRLDRLDLSNPAARLSATANWRAVDETADQAADDGNRPTPRRTAVDFRLDVNNAGALLDRAGLPRTLQGGAGVLYGDVDWRGGPTAIDYPTLNGNLAIDLAHGRILRVNPVLARLLGLLSLQSFARFPSMDFHGVFGRGLHFSRVTGVARIHDGVAHTDNFRVVTAPARGDASGDIDLARRTLAMHVHVAPTISAGAGVVAAAVVNPLFGLGALAADFALSHSIETAFALDYSISGPWTQPHVERVRHDQGKMTTQAPAAVH